MKRTVVLTLLLFSLIAVNGYGIEFNDHPIQTRMSQAMNSSGRGVSTVAFDVSNGGQVNLDENQSERYSSGQSKFKAGLYSFLIPGWGQYYNGRKTKARAFFAAEIVTWVSYLSLRTYGAWKKDDMIRHAEVKAGANLDGKDDDFFVWLEIYIDTDQYNDLGRLVEPDAEYFPNDESHHWSWQTTEDMAVFRNLRESSRTAYRRAKWVMLAGFFDRVLSMVDAIRDAGGQRQADEGFMLSVAGTPVQLSIDPLADRRQVAFTIYPGF